MAHTHTHMYVVYTHTRTIVKYVHSITTHKVGKHVHSRQYTIQADRQTHLLQMYSFLSLLDLHQSRPICVVIHTIILEQDTMQLDMGALGAL